jgi:hypothetical protein
MVSVFRSPILNTEALVGFLTVVRDLRERGRAEHNSAEDERASANQAGDT